VGEREFLGLYTESRDEEQVLCHVPQTAFFRRSLRDLAGCLGCRPDVGSILEHRARLSRQAYLERLIQEARLRALLVDFGYPPGAADLETMRRLLSVRVEPIFRLETCIEGLLTAHHSFDALIQAYLDAVDRAARGGAVALKSIIAYRSGLEIREPAPDAAARAFEDARREAAGAGRYRLTAQPLLDYLIALALERAARLGLPFQIHTGIGDADIDLRQANPLHLRPVLEGERFRGARIVLLHAGYPYVREAAYLTSLYSGVYLDLSLALPLAQTDMSCILRQALALAPWSKLLYGSDLGALPEAYWLGATQGKRAVAKALEGMVEEETLSEAEAGEAARAILHGTAEALYRL
jgi:hypothetical protein